MWLILALGNPGREYETTRHNAGWLVMDGLEPRISASEWRLDKYAQAEVARATIAGQEVIIAKPQTFMNLSGETATYFAKKEGITPDHVIVIYDDVDVNVGQFQIAFGKGDGNHNGIKSIIEHLKTRDFVRLRIGVGDPARVMPLRGFVLGQLSEAELATIAGLAPSVQKCLETIVGKGVVMAMNEWNK